LPYNQEFKIVELRKKNGRNGNLNLCHDCDVEKPLRIAFGHQARMGKDTCCDLLIQEISGEKVSFAAPLYDILHFAQRTAGFAQEKDRSFLRLVADWAKAKDPDVWVRHLQERIGFCRGNVFISDLRFPNEMKMCKEQGFVTVKVKRNVPVDDSPSENALNGCSFDFEIENNGTIGDLRKKLLDIVEKIGK